MDDRVERGDTRALAVAGVERQQAPFPRCHPPVQSSGDRHHAGRQIDAVRRQTAVVQVAGDLAGATAQVDDLSGRPTYQLYEAILQSAVERLVPQLCRELGGVGLRDGVVAGPDGAEVWVTWIGHLGTIPRTAI